MIREAEIRVQSYEINYYFMSNFLSEEQNIILEKMMEWVVSVLPVEKTTTEKINKDDKHSDPFWQDITTSYITIGGYAGTGKTTLISYFRKELKKKYPKVKVAFCAYTGKASLVLKKKLAENDVLFSTDSISTIHGLIYKPIEDDQDRIVGWERKEEINADLLIIDEASMVDNQIWEDITTYQIPIIAVGDHGQLPPISGTFNLMKEPKYKLEKIHRQASENPIIKVSLQARLFGRIHKTRHSDTVYKISRSDSDTFDQMESLLESWNKDTMILCGYNKTRVKLNSYIRQKIGMETMEPCVNDRVICLRNNHEKGVYNGMIGTIQKIYSFDEHRYFAEIEMDDIADTYSGYILKKQFNNIEPLNFSQNRRWTLDSDLFDFGYAMTVHKSQGGQAKRVIFFEEPNSKMDLDTRKRWLYTGITRAQEELYIIE